MKPAITLKNLSKTYKVHQKEEGLKGSLKALFKRKYKTVKAVKNVSFKIKEGEIVGFMGPNGAGKTTTLKILSGLLHPTGGEVKVLGFNPYQRKNQFLKQIGLVMGQKNQLYWDLPPLETFNLNKEIYEIDKKTYKKTLDYLIKNLDIKKIIHNPSRTLSLGQRMKCEIANALIHTPKVLFLDEPTIGLDVVIQKKLRQFIKDYNQKHKATIILTSHYMGDFEELCKRLIVIDHGKLGYDGDFEKFIQQYAKEKRINLTFLKKVKKKDLAKLGKVVAFNPYKAAIRIKREETTSVAGKLLKKFPIDDIDISEISTESIVRKLFAKG
ncbi:MAG: ATP-binding cassette domain-containing protein [Candidatus Moranbacteria bacterium]|nr:ATP-binding cassette domain-containing protein [Candidatus Moranbacteria bacterium]